MKEIRVTFTDDIFRRLKAVKLKAKHKGWREYILCLAGIKKFTRIE